MEYLSQLLARSVRSVPDRTFLIAGERSWTHAQFRADTGRLASILRARAVRKGDRVGLYLPSMPLMALAFWACQRLGAIPVPLSAMFRHAELRRIVTHTGMRALIADAQTWPYFAPIREEFRALGTCLAATGDGGPDDLVALMRAAADDVADEPCGETDIACLFYTSGTTGTPKGIAQTHFSILSTLRDMMVSHRTRFGTETFVCAVPLFTNYGLNVTLNLCLYEGGTIVLHERWDTARVLADIARYRATYFGGTPTMYVYITNAFDPQKHDLRSLRVCTTGGAPVPQSVIERFEALSGARVTQVYGSTETCGQNVMEPTLGIRKRGSAGLPVGSSRITIIDDDGRELPHGEIGEIVIGGDCVAAGYWNDAAATREAFTPLGWKSGDLGYLDADDYLFVIDRKKDVIIAGGHNIYPLEIETLLYTHPAVAVCAVVGMPDPAKGEVPVAVIVRSEEGQDLTAEQVEAFCRASLAAYKVPRAVHFVDELPVEAAKIRKRELAAALREGNLDRYRRG